MTDPRDERCDHDSQFVDGHWRCLRCGHHPADCCPRHERCVKVELTKLRDELKSHAKRGDLLVDGYYILGRIDSLISQAHECDGGLREALEEAAAGLSAATTKVGFDSENKFRRAIVHGGFEHRAIDSQKAACVICRALSKVSTALAGGEEK